MGCFPGCLLPQSTGSSLFYILFPFLFFFFFVFLRLCPSTSRITQQTMSESAAASLAPAAATRSGCHRGQMRSHGLLRCQAIKRHSTILIVRLARGVVALISLTLDVEGPGQRPKGCQRQHIIWC